MSSAETSTGREGLGGKWQIPLLLAALGLFVAAVLELRPREAPGTIEERIARVETYLAAGVHEPAIEDISRLLQEESVPARERGRLHLSLALALVRAESGRSEHALERVAAILEQFEAALACGVELTGDERSQYAVAWEWGGQGARALRELRAAEQAGVSDAVAVARRVIELRDRIESAEAEERLARIGAFIELAAERPEELLWAVEYKAGLLAETGHVEDALAALREAETTLAGERARAQLGLRAGQLLYEAKRLEEAERALRAVRAKYDRQDGLWSQVVWMLGRIALEDERPREAKTFFEEVTASFTSGPEYNGCRLGIAEASAALGDYEQAETVYRGLSGVGAYPLLSAEEGALQLRLSLTRLFETLRARGEDEAALRFVALLNGELAGEPAAVRALYLEAWADTHRSVGEALAGRPVRGEGEEIDSARVAAREHFQQAGEKYYELSQLVLLDEPRSSAALWSAGEQFDRAGNLAKVIETLGEYVATRTDPARLPQALHRLGKAYQANGQYEEAIAVYSRALAEFPRSAFALSSAVPLAECHLALGPEHFAEAERTLLRLVSKTGDGEELLTPEAREYSQALFMLGEVYAQAGMYEQAIPALEEGIARYANDPRCRAARFQLGECYRRSAAALRGEFGGVENLPRRQQMAGEFLRRMQRAHEMFVDVALGEGEEQDGAAATEGGLARMAMLYAADCLFDMEDYGQALKLYERVSWTYQNDPTALAAYVQIVNCLQRTGKAREAQAAIRRAQQLAAGMAEEAFARKGIGRTREQWREYFDWLSARTLF